MDLSLMTSFRLQAFYTVSSGWGEFTAEPKLEGCSFDSLDLLVILDLLRLNSYPAAFVSPTFIYFETITQYWIVFVLEVLFPVGNIFNPSSKNFIIWPLAPNPTKLCFKVRDKPQ